MATAVSWPAAVIVGQQRGRRLQGLNEPVERGGSKRELTAVAEGVEVSSGTVGRRRTGGGDLRCRRLKTTARRTLRGSWHRVRRWGASGRCGGASGASGRRGSGVERGVSGRRRRARSGELGGGERGGGETRGRGETVEGASWRRPSPSRGWRASQAGRRWPAHRRRSPPSCFVRWRGEEDGDAPGGLGRLGHKVSGLR